MAKISGQLSGMQAICDYTQWSPNTVRRMLTEENFPAVKLGGNWESHTLLVDKWRIWCVLKKYGSTEKVDFAKELLALLVGG